MNVCVHHNSIFYQLQLVAEPLLDRIKPAYPAKPVISKKVGKSLCERLTIGANSGQVEIKLSFCHVYVRNAESYRPAETKRLVCFAPDQSTFVGVKLIIIPL